MIKSSIKRMQRKKYWMFHALSLEGYKCSLSYDRFVEFLNRFHKELESGKSIITFDDGYNSVYNLAFPILKEKNIPFICFLVVDFIDTDGYLSKKQIEEMLDSGLLNIESHGLSHKTLNKLSDSDINKEIAQSKLRLEKMFNCQIEHFAYSHGIYTKSAFSFLKKSGYKKAFIASNDFRNIIFKKRYKIPRINICDNTYDDLMNVYYEKK